MAPKDPPAVHEVHRLAHKGAFCAVAQSLESNSLMASELLWWPPLLCTLPRGCYLYQRRVILMSSACYYHRCPAMLMSDASPRQLNSEGSHRDGQGTTPF